MQLFPLRKSGKESRKRSLSDGAASEKAKVLKAYGAAVSPSNVVTPALANGQAQWSAAAYGQQSYAQPQGWQQPPSAQAPPTQPQQWNAGYSTQQVRMRQM